jgi:hypothetical protein
MNNNQKKLVIEIDKNNVAVKISNKANALLEDVAKKSNKSKNYIASRMIEYAYEFVEYLEGGE